MGTSTKRVLPRSKRVIGNRIVDGSIGSGGAGFPSIAPELILPNRGESKIKKEIKSIVQKDTFYKSISKIIKLQTEYKKSGASIFGGTGFSQRNYHEQVEMISEYLGLEDDIKLKQAFKEANREGYILDNNTKPIDFIKLMFKRIFSNAIEGFSFENASELIDDFDDAETDKEIDGFFGIIFEEIINEEKTEDLLEIETQEELKEELDNIMNQAFIKLKELKTE